MKQSKDIQKKVNKVPKKFRIYKNYNFSQALIRLYCAENRTHEIVEKFKKNKRNIIKKSILFLIGLFQLFKFSVIKKKTDILIISNTKFKIQKALDQLSKKKNIAIIQDFNHKIFEQYKHQNYHIVNKFIFLKLNFSKKNQNEFTMLQNKIIFFKKIVSFYKPKFIYTVEGDSVTDSLIAQICKKKNIKCYCFQHGYDPFLFFPKNYNKFDYKNFFYDFIYLVDSYKTGILLKQKKLVNKFKVLKSKIKLFNLDEKRNIFFGIPTISPNEEGGQSIIIKSAKEIIFFSKKYPNLKIIVRLHPDGISNNIILKNVAHLKNVEIHYPKEKSLEESFRSAKISCFISGSSLISDSLKNYCFPIILIDKNNYNNFSRLKENKIAFLTKKENAFRNEVSKLITKSKELKKKQKLMNKFLKSFYIIK